MRVAIIADDLTGAADTGVQLARAGYRTAVAFRDAPIPPAEDLDAVALDTDSRAMPAGFAARRVMAAGHAVRHARIVYKQRHGGDRARDNRKDLRRSGVPGRKPVLRRRRPAILGRAMRLLDLPFRVNTIPHERRIPCSSHR
jgi:hypothetical protein